MTNECSPAIIDLQNKCFTCSPEEVYKMTFLAIVKTFLELAAVVLLIVGFINEKKVIAFEVKLARAIRIHIRNYRLRKQKEAQKAYAARVQRRAPEDVYEEAEAPVLTVVGKNGSHRVA